MLAPFWAPLFVMAAFVACPVALVSNGGLGVVGVMDLTRNFISIGGEEEASRPPPRVSRRASRRASRQMGDVNNDAEDCEGAIGGDTSIPYRAFRSRVNRCKRHPVTP